MLVNVLIVIQTTVLLTDINDYAKVNEIYSKCKCVAYSSFLHYKTYCYLTDFTSNQPARAAFAVSALPKVL